MNPDSSCDLDYMHYRFYGCNMGRFMKPDNINGNLDIHKPGTCMLMRGQPGKHQ